jgi:hypothetical protein
MQSSIPKEFEDMQSNINRAYSGGVVNGMSWWLGGNPKFGSRIGFTAIRDGTSNTAAFSEWIKGKAGANTPGLNLVYQIAQLSFGGPQQVELRDALRQMICLASFHLVFSPPTLQFRGVFRAPVS